jgi:hypothetical protein
MYVTFLYYKNLCSLLNFTLVMNQSCDWYSPIPKKNTKFLSFERSTFKELFARQCSSTRIWENYDCLYAWANFASFIGFIFLLFIIIFALKRERFGECFLVVVNVGRTKRVPRANHYRTYKNNVSTLNFSYISRLFTNIATPSRDYRRVLE